MLRTGLQVISDSLKALGVLAGHEVPTAAEQQDSLTRLNELIDSWGTHGQTLLVQRQHDLPTVAGTATYLIGPGAAVTLETPMALELVSLVDAGGTELFLDLLTDQASWTQPSKTLAGSPTTAHYARTHGAGVLTLWPVPDAVETVRIYWREALPLFPDLVTPVSLSPGYARALRTNLALELAPEYGRPLDPGLVSAARESLADVKRVALVLVEMGIDPALTDGPTSYNILTD